MDFVIRRNLINLCLRCNYYISRKSVIFRIKKKKNHKIFEPRKYRKYKQQ